jgi:hypothetical protein
MPFRHFTYQAVPFHHLGHPCSISTQFAHKLAVYCCITNLHLNTTHFKVYSTQIEKHALRVVTGTPSLFSVRRECTNKRTLSQ